MRLPCSTDWSSDERQHILSSTCRPGVTWLHLRRLSPGAEDQGQQLDGWHAVAAGPSSLHF